MRESEENQWGEYSLVKKKNLFSQEIVHFSQEISQAFSNI